MKDSFRNAITATLVCTLLCGCNDNKPANDNTIATDTVKFFPVENYFLQQVEKADNDFIGMYKLSLINGIRDSSALSRAEFIKLAENFTRISISDSINKRQYTENSFLDLGTNSYTFDYSGNDKTLPVKNITILADTATMEVKRVFINKAFTTADSAIEEKLGWKTNSGFYINRIITRPGKELRTELITVGWNTKQ